MPSYYFVIRIIVLAFKDLFTPVMSNFLSVVLMANWARTVTSIYDCYNFNYVLSNKVDMLCQKEHNADSGIKKEQIVAILPNILLHMSVCNKSRCLFLLV